MKERNSSISGSSESSGAQEEATVKDLPPPVGTLFLLGLYVAALVGMWFYILLVLLEQ
jgi:hypothetical protein